MSGISRKEQLDLLSALYSYGTNIDKLEEVLPTFSRTQLQSYLRRYRSRISRILSCAGNEPIDLWMNVLSKCHEFEETQPGTSRVKSDDCPDNYLFLLSKSMLYAACFEEHYQGSSPDEPNYNEIYRYFYQLLSGEEPTQLRPGNAKKVLEMISRLKTLVKKPEAQKMLESLLSQEDRLSFLKPDVDIIRACEEKEKNFESAGDENVFESTVLERNRSLTGDNSGVGSQSIEGSSETCAEDSLELRAKQEEIIRTLRNIRGFNPFEIPESLLLNEFNEYSIS